MPKEEKNYRTGFLGVWVSNSREMVEGNLLRPFLTTMSNGKVEDGEYCKLKKEIAKIVVVL